MIKLQDVSVCYPNYTKGVKKSRPALNGISVTVEKGKAYIITGRNGSGKSTLMQVMTGIIPKLQTAKVTGSVQCTVRLGVMLEDSDVFLLQTVYEEMEFVLINQRYPFDEIDATIHRQAGELSINHLLDRQIATLSGGERQRLALAVAMLGNPDVILLDEPLAQIDKNFHAEIVRLLADKTVVIATLNPSLYKELEPIISIYLDDGTISTQAEHRQNADQEPISIFDVPKRQADWKGDHEHTVLKISNLSFAYGSRTIFKDFQMTVKRGEIVAIVGKNGIGKSTLLQLITAAIQPQEGEISIAGENIVGKSVADATKNIGVVWQNPDHQIFQNTIRKEIQWSLQLRHGKKANQDDAIDQSLKQFHLLEVANEHPYSVTKTVRQLVALASAVVVGPQLLLLDEPTQNLDHISTGHFMRQMFQLADQGTSIVIVTHNERLTEYADKVISLEGSNTYEPK